MREYLIAFRNQLLLDIDKLNTELTAKTASLNAVDAELAKPDIREEIADIQTRVPKRK